MTLNTRSVDYRDPPAVLAGRASFGRAKFAQAVKAYRNFVDNPPPRAFKPKKPVCRDDTGEIFPSAAEAAKAAGVCLSGLRKKIKKGQPINGVLWRFAGPSDGHKSKGHGHGIAD